ncbi:YkgJ family cysteine cluster protein [Desulfosporosinus sp. Sb-LF]|uniref:YkgJ family cysteine cluster protein n=1 Tax=Desulfosporosinus sp. Sb-LF TaxID=2560027 RepID=UPI00107FC7BB|nr:YkgJ family cysteine cluster protein [Desulfosporosinus sp. Sb-LF]TGE33447.1 YkgJ family cysteine cluster protein [Desulfosporosinus sp. Sb-LF]
MESLPCASCKGLCCGPVPVTQQELKDIKNRIMEMPHQYRLKLKNQLRYYGTCIFYDLDKNKCSIHSARPSICRAFGHYSNLICFRKPEVAKKQNWNVTENPIGILSVDYTWKNLK